MAGIPGWGPKQVERAVRHAGSLERAGERALPRLPNADDWHSNWLRELHTERARGRWAMAWDDPDFPQVWRELPDPPLVVFGKGIPFSVEDVSCHTAIVGTRKCTDEAQRVAFELGKALAQRSATVVSGLARSGCRSAPWSLFIGGILRPATDLWLGYPMPWSWSRVRPRAGR